VLKTMPRNNLKAVIAVLLVLGLMVTGATVLTCRTASAQGHKPPIAEERGKMPQKQEREKEGFTAWGKEVGGLQAWLGFRIGARRTYHHGQTVTLVVRVRNVGKEKVKFQYLKQFFIENPPIVKDADGKTVPQINIEGGGLIHRPMEASLAPGKEIELADVRYELRPASDRGKPSTGKFPPLYGTGKVSLQYERVFGNSSAGQIKLDPNLSKLATGKLELQVRPAPPAATGFSRSSLAAFDGTRF
jgi:hypothetical protein